MDKVIGNDWSLDSSGAFERAKILSHDVHPEGLDLWRVRFSSQGRLRLDPEVGHILSPLAGKAQFSFEGRSMRLSSGSHLYLPRGLELEVSGDFAAVVLSGGEPEQSAGERPLLRSESLLRTCAHERPLRWILTPQYLSRRVFLHHDRTLVSKSGDPISWFRTTMFDVSGLPKNEDGEPVFKMSYNYRTEPNVLVEVRGVLKVRMARHPYTEAGQVWDAWHRLSAEHTYHLNEAAGGPEEEWVEREGRRAALRNKHEVSLNGGYATLFCVFDPAPTGTEKHRAGAYSDYGPLEDTVGSPDYAAHLRKMAPLDQMVDALSWIDAGGVASGVDEAELRRLAERGAAEQRRHEDELLEALETSHPERVSIVRPWTMETR